AGRVTRQHLNAGPIWGQEFDASYAWDNEGRMTSIGYPHGGPVYNYGFDAQGRLNALTTPSPLYPYVTNVGGITYGPASEILSLSYFGLPRHLQLHVADDAADRERDDGYAVQLHGGREQWPDCIEHGLDRGRDGELFVRRTEPAVRGDERELG